MNVTVNSQTLAAELRLLNKIAPSKPSIAILSHALFQADDRLHMYATDLELSLGTDCAAQVDEVGEVALPIGNLLAMVEQFPDADVNVAADRTQVVVRCGGFKSRLQALPTDDFPEMPQPDGEAITLDAKSFGYLIARTRHAVSATTTKHVLKGALLTLAEANGSGSGIAAMVATDSKQLALATSAYSGPALSVVIPVKTLDVLVGQLDDGQVEVTLGKRHSFYAVGGRLLASRMLEGAFPKYERIIPKQNDKLIVVERQAFASALRRVKLAAGETAAVYMKMADGTMELSSSSAEVGSADESVRIAYDGPPLKICINGGFVLDFLNASSKQQVTMALKDQKSAALLTDGDDYITVIMLMR